MNIEVITKEDLQVLRRELLEDLKQFLFNSKQEPKKWLRSADVKAAEELEPPSAEQSEPVPAEQLEPLLRDQIW